MSLRPLFRPLSSEEMKFLPSIPANARWPASPAGVNAVDPYYKIRRQAELASRGTTVLPKSLRERHEEAQRLSRPLRVLDEAASIPAHSLSHLALGGSIAPASLPKADVLPAPSAPVEPAPPAQPVVAPVAETVDAIVVAEQDDNEEFLRRIEPHAMIEFKHAARRLEEAADLAGYEQSAVLAQGLESLRRALNKMADRLLPPTPGEIEDRLGKPAPTHERAYASRISLFVQQATDSTGKFRLGKREVELHHQRLKSLIERIANQVHGEGDFVESRQLYVGAWQIVATVRPYESKISPQRAAEPGNTN